MFGISVGLVLAPGGVGNLLSLLVAGRLITLIDQRWLLALGCVLNALATYLMSTVTLGVDYWALAWPRFLQGIGALGDWLDSFFSQLRL